MRLALPPVVVRSIAIGLSRLGVSSRRGRWWAGRPTSRDEDDRGGCEYWAAPRCAGGADLSLTRLGRWLSQIPMRSDACYAARFPEGRRRARGSGVEPFEKRDLLDEHPNLVLDLPLERLFDLRCSCDREARESVAARSSAGVAGARAAWRASGLGSPHGRFGSAGDQAKGRRTSRHCASGSDPRCRRRS